jgi:hypothetical protein
MSVVLKHSPPVAADPICAAAVDLAWSAAVDDGGPEAVGAHVGLTAESELLVSHTFACTMPGYVGWQWHVVLTRAQRSRKVTVSEVDLMPTPGALLAPEWVPWNERIRPGDLSAGNVVPTDPDDARLAPGWSGADELAGELEPGPLHPVNWEPGLGRPRVPSSVGRSEAASRWYRGEHGPRDPIARVAPGQCSSCGWMMTVGGPLGQTFGICSNMLSPSDGNVVSFDHGCGGHSEATTDSALPSGSVVLDDHQVGDLDMGHS